MSDNTWIDPSSGEVRNRESLLYNETEHRRRRIGIMGGTFDPIHNGHLVAASEVQHYFDLDEVVFVPTAEQPFKKGKRVTFAEHRYLMTVIATAPNPRFSVSRVDIDRGGTTYTIDTLRDLRKVYPDAEMFFITGADVLPQILRWKDQEELWDLAHFVGVNRPGHVLDTSALPEGSVSVLEIPAMAISSTGVRNRVASGVPVWYLMPDGVVRYISKYHLYRPEEAITTALASVVGDYEPNADPGKEIL
ncbi:nicotinate-nucleotide adenylyltransferase [Arcanobacterium wilhelmae]|uniref:Probable nicotinate-nucleotide adenylyltransferase n=1 Tax=Arcanobacterium wilhelmae TaxID=1803177 RepID=A0ABT9NDC1_9ACTO|nr:nicotinate-nucleotide adenylyltransferase [Arcanobacterium wilhelmae]MDP9801647.1 nicotinate-nucleotide adenylyltransferase [Arcanobacterium wilhelmae]WFN90968.1 nicotinate-nucleotide adenylyltransferase [Arcanobacterium wilhelmae]